MSSASTKMQIRTEVLSVLNKYRISENQNFNLTQDIEHIRSLSDNDYVAFIIFNELKNTNTDYIDIYAIFALETIEIGIFEKHAINFLSNSSISDKKKFFMISLMKQKGLYFDYNNISNYINNAEGLAQDGIKEFLNNALSDPEVQIDLLDFYVNIPLNEKISLLTSLAKDEIDDNLSAALSLIVQTYVEKDELEIILDILLTSKSVYCLEGLKFILNNYDIQEKDKTKIIKTIKAIEFKNRDFKNDLIIKNSEIFDSFISFIDGFSSFSLAIARKTKDKYIDCLFLTINTKIGISACMGFGNITFENYFDIKKRLLNDTVPIEINPIALKGIIKYYQNKNSRTKTKLPYEFIVWKNLLNDVADINYDISEFINSKLNITALNNKNVLKFINSKHITTWYYAYNQNENIDEIIDKIIDLHIIDLEEIDKITEKYIEDYFISNKEFLDELNDKLLLQAYVLMLLKLKLSSAVSYSICFNEKYKKLLIASIIDRSIYNYFYQKSNEENDDFTNIFKKEKKLSFSKDETELILSQLEEKWL